MVPVVVTPPFVGLLNGPQSTTVTGEQYCICTDYIDVEIIKLAIET